MSSSLKIPSEIDYDTTRADPLYERQWYFNLSSLMDIEWNASSNGMVGGYLHEEPMIPFCLPHDGTASYYEDAIAGFNDAFVPNNFPSQNQMMTLSSPFGPKDPIIPGAGSLKNALSLMAKYFAAKSASRLEALEHLERNFDCLSSQFQNLKRIVDCVSSQFQDLKAQFGIKYRPVLTACNRWSPTARKDGHGLDAPPKMNGQPEIELPQAEVAENDESHFRVFVDSRSIKYITIEPGIYNSENMCFGPSLVPLLPRFPPGDWNDGLNTWHEIFIDYSELLVGRKLRTGIYETRASSFHDIVVVKFARFPWEVQYIENETTAYQWIVGHDIGPRFLGHLTENGRVIGFLLERITDSRHAGAQDTEICEEVLSRLHDLGVRHGDTNRSNFLVRDSRATLIDFDTAQKFANREVLLQELKDLSMCLKSSSGRGGGGVL
ncbi:alpha-galactosidase A precursor [Penicillium odoratum]|uniref:alpha-galactosidase A precursor n=1 Tax=Penicillium odoratum TaxID=1167516 RepID=UPI002548BDD7|nr:alpha-galactosidase A precursor [Penicillium odoratum]KAJ5761068.1 alpha-galactosidase A precursor [Penicillium odoratum]